MFEDKEQKSLSFPIGGLLLKVQRESDADDAYVFLYRVTFVSTARLLHVWVRALGVSILDALVG